MGAPTPNLRVHLREWVLGLDNAQQREQISKCVLKGTVQVEHLAKHLLAPPARIIFGGDLEVSVQEIDERQIGASFGV